jgi:hypothetical protein
MATPTAPSGGIAVRWAYGVFLTLCVALAVLAHHETSGTEVSPMRASAHVGHKMAAETPLSASEPSKNSADAGGCGMLGMQHCTTAGVNSVQLAAPGPSTFDPLAYLPTASAGHSLATAVGRAPPDLSVLSQLRL